jgi:hypothetical protein
LTGGNLPILKKLSMSQMNKLKTLQLAQAFNIYCTKTIILYGSIKIFHFNIQMYLKCYVFIYLYIYLLLMYIIILF